MKDEATALGKKVLCLMSILYSKRKEATQWLDGLHGLLTPKKSMIPDPGEVGASAHQAAVLTRS